MSLHGTKRTCRGLACNVRFPGQTGHGSGWVVMSAFDPKRTLRSQRARDRTSARRAWRALRLRGNPALISGDSPIADEGGYYENCRAAVTSYLLTGGYLWGVLHQAFRPLAPRTADDDDRHDLSRAKRLAL